jgi:hypothetical protein
VLKAIDMGIRAAAAITRWFDRGASRLAEYENWVIELHRAYLSERRQYYHSVKRWVSSSRFWKRCAGG